MTTEVALLNKKAVALAADSAVTISTYNGHKVFNSANKIFRLTKKSDTGILIYSNAEFHGTPLELIVKVFRKKYAQKQCDDLFEWGSIFIEFLKSNDITNSKYDKIYLLNTVRQAYTFIDSAVNKHIDLLKSKNEEATHDQISIIISNLLKDITALPRVEGMSEDQEQLFFGEIGEDVHETLRVVMPDIFPQFLPNIHAFCLHFITRQNAIRSSTGIVIAGFGDQDNFPKIVSFTVYGTLGETLLYSRGESHEISQENDVLILPLAQRDVIDTFLFGIHPDHRSALEESIQIATNNTFETLSNTFNSDPNDDTPQHLSVINAASSHLRNQVSDVFLNKSMQSASPILDAVKFLSIPDLAQMAHNLVELTSFRQKVSLDVESVGGPIDVAVISKGDGFIWVKRKHYFKKEFNEHFFSDSNN